MTQALTVEAVIDYLADDIHETATEKGFWSPSPDFLASINTKLLLIVSEAIEAHDVLRKQYEGEVEPTYGMTDEQRAEFLEELADVFIRTLDLGRYFTWEFGQIITSKMEKNRSRPTKHGKRF